MIDGTDDRLFVTQCRIVSMREPSVDRAQRAGRCVAQSSRVARRIIPDSRLAAPFNNEGCEPTRAAV